MSQGSASSSSSGGIGFAGALTIAFIVLKLLGKIGWSWWWVLSPLWISWAFVGFILLVVGVFYVFGKNIDRRAANRRRERRLNSSTYRTSQGRRMARKSRHF